MMNLYIVYTLYFVFVSAFTTQNSNSGSDVYSYILLIAIFGLIIYRRIKRGINGRPYSFRRIITTPIIYSLLLVYFLAVLYSFIIYDFIALILIIPGFIVGDRIGSLSTVYWEGKVLMYKRSTMVLFLTLMLYFIRIVLEFVVNTTNIYLLTAVNASLALSLGILIGEFLHLKTSARELLLNQTRNEGINNA
ncbi:DUF1453 family protein [Cuniculiplasma divulgatum]|uniref:Multipass membrane protein n=1 Tax=Cuniculiplasma divulgatum TaxID=1673428 RepID=A0A1N5U8F8_9ARCH|nr:DUF1453 family protein [Cuniculiplasma divulgatum]SIM56428.1 multipass membrane protein [Cuniculiplasma divulgatum]